MTPRAGARGERHLLALVLVGLVAAAGAQAAISWTSQSSITTSARDPPVQFQKGDWVPGHERYLKDFSISTNGTSFSATVKARTGATIVVKDVVRVVNPTSTDRTVTVTGTPVASSQVKYFAWHVHDGTSQRGALNHRDADPSVTFTVPAETAYQLDLHLQTKGGGHQGTARVPFDVGVTTS